MAEILDEEIDAEMENLWMGEMREVINNVWLKYLYDLASVSDQ